MSPSLARRTTVVALLAVAASVTVAGCTAAVPMSPAAGSNDPSCAQVTVHLPEVVDTNNQRRETDAQATGAWGDPAAVLLHCGVTTPTVSDLPCYRIGGVDWLIDTDPEDADTSVLTTYGRTPGVQVIVDSTKANGGNVLHDLADAVGYLPVDRQCVGAQDVPDPGDDPSATPTP
ncbi:DUF3515 family protein [Frigoribacterium sp. 2-23]|uniref:DUF3515 family protein n=1 Tax=Frigoribacterium sp. 2-23 TaxID=3415006 RepID=UPI003C6F6BBF